MAYTSASVIKTYKGITASGDDAFIDTLITRATGMINAFTRRNFEAATGTRTFSPIEDAYGPTLYFDEDLATASGLVITNGDGASIIASDIVFKPVNRAPYYAVKLRQSVNKTWTYDEDPDDAIIVSGKWGWSTTVPEDVKQAAIRLVVFLYHQKDNSQDIDRPIITPDGSVVMPMKLPADVQAILKPYVRNAG